MASLVFERSRRNASWLNLYAAFQNFRYKLAGQEQLTSTQGLKSLYSQMRRQ